MWGRLAEFCVAIPLLIHRQLFGGDNCAGHGTKKIAACCCELGGKNLKNESDGCLALGEGTPEKSYKSSSRNRTHDLRNAGQLF